MASPLAVGLFTSCLAAAASMFIPPAGVEPWMKCNFEECSRWRFLEREPHWHVSGFIGNQTTPPANHSTGFYYTNQTGSAIAASFPLLPLTLGKNNESLPKIYCLSLVYRMCGNAKNLLDLKSFAYPIVKGNSESVWDISQGEKCHRNWRIQTSQVWVESKLVLILNATRFKPENETVDSVIQLKSIDVFNQSCRYPMTTAHPMTSTMALPRLPSQPNDTLTVIEGERFGRIENSADRLFRMFKNESWLIIVSEVEGLGQSNADYYETRTTAPVVAVRFSWLDIQDSPNCSLAGLFLYDGANESYPLLGAFCGKERPREIFTSTSNEMFIDFRILGDTYPTGTGFKFTFDTWMTYVTPAPTTTPHPTTVTSPRDVSWLYTYFCDFEDGRFCLNLFESWEMSMFKWVNLRAQQLSDVSNLPREDKTTSTTTGSYAVSLANGRRPGDVAVMITRREFDVTTVDCLNFWYYKTGSVTGRLAVSLVFGEEFRTVLVIRGDRGSEWRNAQVAVPQGVPSGSFRVAFQATVGSDPGGSSSMALDDVGFFKAWWCKTKS